MKRFIETYKDTLFDVIVIGGGITGAAVAYEAASRGLNTALLEKGDFSSATSSATSKLIHGGLRYLAKGEFSLVRESLRERKIMESIAPNFVYPIPVMIPFYKNSKLAKLKIKAGMVLYDLLSFDKQFVHDQSKKIPSHHSIRTSEIIKIEPGIKREGLDGSVIYYDCLNLIPERLTLAFIKSAVKHGASVANYSRVSGFIYDATNRISGVKVTDIIYNKHKTIRGSLVINCTGPWTDITLHMDKKSTSQPHITRSEGIHIITAKINQSHVIVSMTPEGRHLFMIPWRDHTLFGTTDSEYSGDPDKYQVTKKSISGLLSDINNSFGNITVKYRDIKHCYGGLRPLVENSAGSTYEASRKFEILDNEKDGIKGMITAEGGKYTTSRNLAEKVVNLAARKLNIPVHKSKTATQFLSVSEIPDINEYLLNAKKENSDFNEKTVETLVKYYGNEFSDILDIARENSLYAEKINFDGEILAQVIFAVRKEQAFNLDDILLRRTGIGTLGNPGMQVLKNIAACAGRELNWTMQKRFNEINKILELLQIPKK